MSSQLELRILSRQIVAIRFQRIGIARPEVFKYGAVRESGYGDLVMTVGAPIGTHGRAAPIADKIKDVVGGRKCYVALDVDAMDPAHTSGTGTPAPGGLTSALQREILWHLN